MTAPIQPATPVPARIAVRLGAIAANYRTMREKGGRAAAVVKADAYGLGMAQVAPALAASGCDTFFVARLAEGVALRALLPGSRIFVLDGALPGTAAALAAHALVPVLNDLEQIAAWKGPAALHVDTGMNRLGLPPDQLAVLAGKRSLLSGIDVVLVMSHLACADDPDHPMNARQLEHFRATLAMLPPAPASLAASAGVMLGRDYHFDLVRPGVALYGANPCPNAGNPMKTAVTFTGEVAGLRRIDRGQTVGYAATFTAERPSMIATVALGYADGILRSASNRGMAAIGGVPVPYAGRLSMDLLTLDVTELPSPPAIGDPVEILGDTIRLEDAAATFGTIPYEILTGLSRRVPRHYTEDAS